MIPRSSVVYDYNASVYTILGMHGDGFISDEPRNVTR